MPVEYVVIQARDIISHLEAQGFHRLLLPDTKEIVMGKAKRLMQVTEDGKPYPDGWVMPLSIRVYTSITLGGQREKGKDAIRVAVFALRSVDDNKTNAFMLGGDKRVHRVKGWRDNLQDRIDNWMHCIEPFCPECSAPMILHKPEKGANQFTPFYGCIRFRTNKCRGARPYEEK